MSKTIYERIYERLEALGIDPAHLPESAKSKAPGFMDLNLDRLETTQDSVIIALSHYFQQHGDLVPDPDMQIRMLPAARMAEALTYQDQFSYRMVHPEPRKVDLAAKRELNSFLAKWLKNCLDQGHSFAYQQEAT
jgi:uncharacterized protein YqiB (DUF1249 family)